MDILLVIKSDEGQDASWQTKPIPAGSYPGQDKQLLTIGLLYAHWIDKSLPEDLVYDMTKAAFDGYEDWAITPVPEFSRVVKPWAEAMTERATVPFHKGVAKFVEGREDSRAISAVVTCGNLTLHNRRRHGRYPVTHSHWVTGQSEMTRRLTYDGSGTA